MKCPVCCSACLTSFYSLYDDRYGFEGLFDAVCCPTCSHKFLDAEFSTAQLLSLYTDYYPRSSFSMEQFRPKCEISGLRAWFNGERRSAYTWVPPNVRVLDIGCGFGETLAYHKSRGCDVYGVEADENIRRVAEKFGFKVNVGLFDPENYEADTFDYVTMDQVIEHVTAPHEAMCGIAQVLKPGGVAILSTPNASGWGARLFERRWINWHAPYHLQHFSHKSMQLAAENAGLVLESVRTITSSEWLNYQWIHLLTFPGMGEASPFWSLKVRRSFGMKLLHVFFRCLHRTKINHLITRFFDSIGLGDNYLFFLRKP